MDLRLLMKKIDQTYLQCEWKSHFFDSFRILVGRLFGPVDFSLFSEDMIKFKMLDNKEIGL